MPATTEKAGKSIVVIHSVCQAFEELTTGCGRSDRHPLPMLGKDFDTVLKTLNDNIMSVFWLISGRGYPTFTF